MKEELEPTPPSTIDHDAALARRRRRRFWQRLIVYPAMILMAKLIGCNHLFYHPDARTYTTRSQLASASHEVFFRSGDGTRLHGWFLESLTPGDPVGTVVHFHGNAQNLTSHVRAVDWLTARGFNVFVFDYRGYGKSDGKPDREGIHRDSVAALQYVRGRDGVDATRIVVLGQSLGGACGRAALGEGSRDGVRAVAVDSTFLWYRDVANDTLGGTVFTYPFAWLLISNEHSPGQSIDRLGSIPVLVLHGSGDQVVSVDNGRAVHDAVVGPKRLEIVEGAEHLRVLDGPARELLVDFFRENLGAKR